MYDKITAWIDREVIGSERFEALRWHANDKGWFGVGSISFRCSEHTIKCTGSLCKWRDGCNVKTMTFGEAVEVIGELCDWIDVAPSEIRVSGLEFGATIEVVEHPSRYLELLGEMSRAKRLPTAKGKELQTVVYRSMGEKLSYSHIFYDKGAEAGVDKNLLRFELRYYRETLRQITGKGGTLWLSMLQDATLFTRLQTLYLSKLKSVKKLGQANNKNGSVTKVAEGFDMLVGQLLKVDPSIVERHIADLKRKKVFKDPKYYTRLQEKFNKTLERWGGGDASVDLVAEITSKAETEISRCAPLE